MSWHLFYVYVVKSDHFLVAVLIPMLISIYGISTKWKKIIELKYWISFSVAASLIYLSYQAYFGFDEIGVRLAPVMALFVYWLHFKRKNRVSPVVAFTATWLSLFFVDVYGSFVYEHFNQRTESPYLTVEILRWVGAYNWKDGLFLCPIGAAITAWWGCYYYKDKTYENEKTPAA